MGPVKQRCINLAVLQPLLERARVARCNPHPYARISLGDRAHQRTYEQVTSAWKQSNRGEATDTFIGSSYLGTRTIELEHRASCITLQRLTRFRKQHSMAAAIEQWHTNV